MQIKNVEVRNFSAELEPHRLAEASVELADSNADPLIISDIRILQDCQGRVWVEMPSHPQIESNRRLQRRIEGKVLAFYEALEARKLRCALMNTAILERAD